MFSACVFLVQLIVLIWSDLAYRRIGNIPVVALLLTGLGVVLLNGLPWGHSVADALLAGLIGLIGLLPFYALGWMGAGDVKLAAALGVWLGVEQLFFAWVLSNLMVLAYTGILMAGRQWPVLAIWTTAVVSRQRVVPYGALLCLAAVFVTWKWWQALI